MAPCPPLDPPLSAISLERTVEGAYGPDRRPNSAKSQCLTVGTRSTVPNRDGPVALPATLACMSPVDYICPCRPRRSPGDNSISARQLWRPSQTVADHFLSAILRSSTTANVITITKLVFERGTRRSPCAAERSRERAASSAFDRQSSPR